MEHDQELDTRGLNCPLPMLRTKKAINTRASGQVFENCDHRSGCREGF